MPIHNKNIGSSIRAFRMAIALPTVMLIGFSRGVMN